MNKITSELKNVKTVAIAGHIRPDGDCVGSCMGMYLYIKDNFPDIQVDVYLESISSVFDFIKDTENIRNTYTKDIRYDLFLSLDASDKARLGESVKYLDTAKKTICIDHHISNDGFADINYVYPNASSTSELVYDLIEEEKVTKEIAEAIYMGIAHDTGVFQYSCTSPKTMNIAGKLMQTGIAFSKIVDETYYKKTYVQNQILGRALLESILVLDGKCIISTVNKKEMDFYNVGPQDLDGIVSQLRVTQGVEAAIFIYEIGPLQHKVSLRSNGRVNVSMVASYFGGGGHIMASGCNLQGTIHDAINNLLKEITKQL